MKSLLKIITILFVFLIIPSIVFILIASHSSFLFGIRSFDVMTGSMESVLHVGSMVFTRPATVYQVGDVITFKRGTIFVTHRIYGIKDDRFITKGDANKSPDSQLISKSQIIGKNFLTIPNIGKFTKFIKTVPGFLIFIVVPILIFIGFEIKTILMEFEKEIRKKVLLEMQEVKIT